MPVNVLTHLNVAGNAREALDSHHTVFGGQLNIGTYGQSGAPRLDVIRAGHLRPGTGRLSRR